MFSELKWMEESMKEIKIHTDYVTLGQFLKIADINQSGGEAKPFLSQNDVYVNGEIDNRRGRKLRDLDVVVVEGKEFRILNENK